MPGWIVIVGLIAGTILFMIVNKVLSITYFGFRAMAMTWGGCFVVSCVLINMLSEYIQGNAGGVLLFLAVAIAAVFALFILLKRFTKKQSIQQPVKPVTASTKTDQNHSANADTNDTLTSTLPCPKCGFIGVEDEYCRKCGTHLIVSKCNKCGEPYDPDDVYCGKCGLRLQA